jgi:hypothetical protein
MGRRLAPIEIEHPKTLSQLCADQMASGMSNGWGLKSQAQEPPIKFFPIA